MPLTPPASQSAAKPPLSALKDLRKEYASLLLEKMRAPDGSYEENLSVPGVDELPPPTDKISANLQRNNPLSLHEDVSKSFLFLNEDAETSFHKNPWNDWLTALELRKTIRQDVERT